MEKYIAALLLLKRMYYVRLFNQFYLDPVFRGIYRGKRHHEGIFIIITKYYFIFCNLVITVTEKYTMYILHRIILKLLYILIYKMIILYL